MPHLDGGWNSVARSDVLADEPDCSIGQIHLAPLNVT